MKARIAVALSVLAILVATLHQSGKTIAPGWTLSIASGGEALAELIQNLLLFIPLGISLTLAGVPLVRTVVIGALLSFSVEFAQQWIPGRDPSVGDLLCNSISTALGAGLVRLATHWLLTPPDRSAWQAVGTAVIAVLVWLGTAAVVRPTFPPPPYRVLFAPDVARWGHYQGEIRSAKLERGMLAVEAVAPSRPPGRRSPLAMIMDARNIRATILAVHGHDLSLRYNIPAVALRLEHPDLRWRDALAGIAPGDTFTATTGHEDGKICLALHRDWRCDLGYTIGDGWKLIFYPEGWPSWILAMINACWVAGCVIGVGYWAARTQGGEKGQQRAAKVAVAIALIGLIAVPSVTVLKGTSLVEWIGALGGLELGMMLGSLTAPASE